MLNPVTWIVNCLNSLVFSFVLSHYQVVHGLWGEVLIRGVEWRGRGREGGGGGRGKHRITGGHGPGGPVILHEVVQVGLRQSKNIENSLIWNIKGFLTFMGKYFPHLFTSWLDWIMRGKDECFWVWAIQHAMRFLSCSTFLLSFAVAQWSFDFS